MPSIEDLRRVSARVAGCAELQDIRTFSLSAELNSLPADGGRLAFKLEPVVEVDRFADDAFSVNAFFRLSIIGVESDSEEHDVAVSDEDVPVLSEIKFKLAALYSLQPLQGQVDEPITDEEVTNFAQSTGLMALYPYARATVSDLTGRIGLPNLTLPMLKADITDEMTSEAPGT